MDSAEQNAPQPQQSELPQPDKKSYAMTVVVGLFVFFLGALLLLAARSTNLQKAGERQSPTAATIVQQQPSTQAVEGANTSSGMKLTVTSPKDKSTVRSPVMSVTGKTGANADVSVNDKELVANSIGYFSTSITLDEGENTVNILAVDKDGNYAERELTVTYEPTE